MATKGEIYISVDVETDGPIPGDCNMVSVGAAVCGKTMLGEGFSRSVNRSTFYRELRTQSPGDSRTREWLAGQGFEVDGPKSIAPEVAMRQFKRWVLSVSETHECRPVFVAYPLGFDWSFTHWYFEHFLGFKQDPFGFSNALDVKTLFSARSGRALLGSTKKSMGKLRPDAKHTHNALDDAVEQGELFANIMEWDPR
jgi:hypothetical protein